LGTSHHTIKAGTTSKTLLVHGHSRPDAAQGATGLRHDTPGAVAAYVREGEAQPHRIQLAEGLLGKHAPGSFVEVDPELLPGVYQFGAPDEMLAPGSTLAILMFRFPGATFDCQEVALVAYDPQDEWCMGVEGLANRRRHEFLRRALPRLTEMELELGRQAEQELSARLGDQE
jgi:hypothetical protein